MMSCEGHTISRKLGFSGRFMIPSIFPYVRLLKKATRDTDRGLAYIKLIGGLIGFCACYSCGQIPSTLYLQIQWSLVYLPSR